MNKYEKLANYFLVLQIGAMILMFMHVGTPYTGLYAIMGVMPVLVCNYLSLKRRASNVD